MREKGAPEIVGHVGPQSKFYWVAYHHLRGSRQMGFGIGPIPMTEILAYAEHAGISCPVNRSRFIRMMVRLDNVEREHHGNAKRQD